MTNLHSNMVLTSIRSGLSIGELFSPNKDRRVETIISKTWEHLAEKKNYIRHTKLINLDELDSLLSFYDMKFREMGVYPERNGYKVAGFDLLEQVQEFIEATPIQVKAAMIRLSDILKKHNTHGVALLQANESLFRNSSSIIRNINDLDYYFPKLSTVYNGSAFAEKSRRVVSLHRPRVLKLQYFPDRKEEIELDPDYLHCNIIKTNLDKQAYFSYICYFEQSMRVYPIKDEDILKNTTKENEDE